MYQLVVTPRTTPVVTPEQLAAFGRFDVPQSSPMTLDYQLLQLFVSAATDQVEILAATSALTQQMLLTLDFFPNTTDPRLLMQYQYDLGYSYSSPWWWYGFPARDSIELVRRPVVVPTLGTVANVTAISLASNVLTVTCANTFSKGQVVVLNTIAENTPGSSTVPYLTGIPLAITGATGLQFTATFNNFYTTGTSANGQQTTIPGSYTNNAASGTATLIVNPLIVTYYDSNGVLVTWSTTYYFVAYDKITLTANSVWPVTHKKQDSIQILYWSGNNTLPANVDARLQMAVLFLAANFWENRSIVSVEPTTEVGKTLSLMLSSYRTLRLPR